MTKVAIASSVALAVIASGGCADRFVPGTTASLDRIPSIFPDYDGVTIPPNIAPLDFAIREPGDAFHVVVKGDAGELAVDARDPTIRFPVRAWHALAGTSAGKDLAIEVSVRLDGQWLRYRPLRMRVAPERVDPYLVYRLIHPGYEWWSEMGIYQRDLESFDESPILRNDSIDHACVNCHSFRGNDPDTFTVQLRKTHAGTLIAHNGKVGKVETQVAPMPGPGVYSSWHPSGKAIAFSVNRVVQVFPSTARWHIEVFDTESDLMVYDTRSGTASSAPAVATPDLENLPAWAPDGKYLYYCRAARSGGPAFNIDDASGGIIVEGSGGSWQSDPADVEGGRQDNARVVDLKQRTYDLMRVSYDVDARTWGTPEVVLASGETGKSISFPRISPDGRYLMFTLSAFGYFTIHHADADLYVMDLASRKYRRLDEVNSDDVESFHSWSSNGRWFVFSSKRLDGIRARPFLAYFDQAGNARKPLLLPQESPDTYRTLLMTYNVPELVTGKVRFSERELRNRSLQEATPIAWAR